MVEDVDTILAAPPTASTRFHDPSPARCSGSRGPVLAVLGDGRPAARDRRAGPRARRPPPHPPAETLDEEEYCREHFGSRRSSTSRSSAGWARTCGSRTCVHLDDADIATLAAHRHGCAHCPRSNARLGAGIARARDLRDAGVTVGLGVDGAASNEGSLADELRQVVFFARARGGAQALSVRDALERRRRGAPRAGAPGRDRLDRGRQAGRPRRLGPRGLGHVDVADPVVALVIGATPPLRLLLVRGEAVVSGGELTTVDVDAVAAEVAASSRALLQRAGVTS